VRVEELDRSAASRGFMRLPNEAWFLLCEAHSWFVAAFRAAASKLKVVATRPPLPVSFDS
jgi:hypothetical protein